jgi:hypothetical protein
MEKVTTEKQLIITAEDKEGMLSEVAGLIADNGVNIDNFCAYSSGGKAVLRLITGNNAKAVQALEGRGFHIEETEVILLRLWNRPGSLSSVTAKLKPHGIFLEHVYGTSSMGGERMSVIFSSNDNEKAASIFTSMVLEEG